jgi:hypothetical protein
MTELLRSRLRPVRFRQQALFALHAATVGLLVGSCAAGVLALTRLIGLPVSTAAVVGAAAAGLVGGAVWGAARWRSWHDAAQAVDCHYRLKDRAVTALAFAQSPEAGTLHRLQIEDTLARLEAVDPRQVAPWKAPKPLPWALGALALAAALTLVPLPGPGPQPALAAAMPEILADAEELEATVLEDLEKLAEEQKDERIEKLLEELKELVEELKEPGVDFRDELATLSAMELAIAQAQAEFNLESVDAQLQKLAEALSPAAAMQSASAALQEGEYNQAAESLEEFDPQDLSRKEKSAVADNLKKLAKEMKDDGQSQLGDAASEMSEGLENDDASQSQSGACKLSGQCRAQGLRKGISECLGQQLASLSLCKSNCQGNCNGNKNGGEQVARSDTPKNTWGRGATNQPLTDESTGIDATRQRENIRGVQGEGPSEREVSHSAEGRDQASREYREKYREFRKITEAVLESEPLPLGHRQTIRKYFESIRPEGGDDPAE